MRAKEIRAATTTVPVARFAAASRLGRPAGPERAASQIAIPHATARRDKRAARSVWSSASRGASVRRHAQKTKSGSVIRASVGNVPDWPRKAAKQT